MIAVFIASSLVNTTQEPSDLQFDQAKLKAANERLRSHIHAGNLVGAVTLVMKDGKVVSHTPVGYQDYETKKLMSRDTIFQVMSMTKPVTGAAMMICVERGLVNLDDPIEYYLPKFKDIHVKEGSALARPASTRPTIRHLLTHTSGLSGDDPGGISDDDKAKMPLREYAKLLGTEPLRTDPGTTVRYSGVGFSTMAAIIEIVTKTPFDQFVDKEILKPLGMTHTTFFLPARYNDKLTKVYIKEEGKLKPMFYDRYRSGAKFANGAGGLYSTASDMAKFIDAFRVGSKANILSPNTVKLMTSVQTGNLLTDGNDARGYGLSWSIVRNPGAQSTLRSIGSFGHAGAFGTDFWHDPSTGVTVVYMAQTWGIGDDARKQFATMVNASLVLKR